MSISTIVATLLDELGAERRVARRPISDHEHSLLVSTTDLLLRQAHLYVHDQNTLHEFRSTFLHMVRQHARDQRYDLDEQVKYFHRLRALTIHSTSIPGAHLHIATFFDQLVLWVIEVFRRPKRFDWPLLVIVGFGDLAERYLVPPLKDLLDTTYVDVWLVDRDKTRLDVARDLIGSRVGFRILSADESSQELRGVLDRDIIVYVTTDTKNHLGAVETYLELNPSVIAIEKPLCATEADCLRFLDLDVRRQTSLVVVDHYEFRRATLYIERLQRHSAEIYKAITSGAHTLRFEMLEKAHVVARRGAASEGVILDMLPHLFPFVSAFFTRDFKTIAIRSIERWRYEDAPTPESTETAVRAILDDGHGHKIEAFAGKGLREDRKCVSLISDAYTLVLDLDSGAVEIRGAKTITLGGVPTKNIKYGVVLHTLLTAAGTQFQSIQQGAEVVQLLLKMRSYDLTGGYRKNASPWD